MQRYRFRRVFDLSKIQCQGALILKETAMLCNLVALLLILILTTVRHNMSGACWVSESDRLKWCCLSRGRPRRRLWVTFPHWAKEVLLEPNPKRPWDRSCLWVKCLRKPLLLRYSRVSSDAPACCEELEWLWSASTLTALRHPFSSLFRSEVSWICWSRSWRRMPYQSTWSGPGRRRAKGQSWRRTGQKLWIPLRYEPLFKPWLMIWFITVKNKLIWCLAV